MSSLLTLSKGENYFRTLFDACGEAFIVTTEQGRALDCNDAALDLFACQRNDILGTTPLDWSPELQPDGRRSNEAAAEIFARAAVGETVCFEWENFRLDRRPVFVSVTVRRAVIDGHVCYMIVSRNISDRKQAEDTLREERLLRDTIQNAIPGVAYALDTKGCFRFWSHSFEIVTGRNADELKRITALDLFEGDDCAHISERIKVVFEKGEGDAEAELVSKNGRRMPYYFTGRRIELNGESILVGAGMDITERVQAERALREEQDRFRTLFESSPDPVWIIENNKFIECNEAAAKILGFTDRSKLLFVHPSELSPEFQPDGESSFAKAERMLETARRKGINRFEWTHTRANGEDFPAEVTLSSITLQGRPVIYCVWRDITERKQAEEALLQSDITFRKLFEESADAILLIDKSRVFVECNQAALNLLKMRREDFLYRPPVMISPEFQPNGRRSDEAAQDMIDQAYAKGLHRFDWTCVNAEGEEFIVEVSLMPITVKGQTMLHTTWRDITERKRTQRLIEMRIAALTKPMEGGSVAFDELFNLEEIQRIQDEFAMATGVASIITRPDGTPITSPSNFTRLCSDIIRKTTVGCANCFKSDSVIGRYNPNGPIVQTCLSGGLWDAGACITLGGDHVANWLIGQVRDETQKEEGMRAYARTIGADEKEFIEAFNDVPAMSRAQFDKVARALFSLANQLSATAYQNIQQARYITERQQAEDALRSSEARFRTLFEQAAVGVAQIDTLSGRFLAVNRKYRDIVGYSEADMLQLDFPSITHPDDLAEDLAHMDKLKSGQIRDFDIEKRYIHKNGHPVWVELTVSPMWAPGELPDKHIAIVQDITQRKEVELKLEKLARTDDLTGLANRRHFLEQAEKELSRSIRYERPLSILMVDADLFKGINDLHGHAVGDTTLRKLADIIRETLRTVDLAGRVGGEEFAILLPETDHDMAIEVAERLRRAVADSKVPLKMGLPLQFTVSIGVSSLISKDDNLDVLISHADTALYHAKNSGRNKVCSSLASTASDLQH